MKNWILKRFFLGGLSKHMSMLGRVGEGEERENPKHTPHQAQR